MNSIQTYDFLKNSNIKMKTISLEIVKTDDGFEELFGIWEGDEIPISRIPNSDIDEFWISYVYTHAGEDWKKVVDYIYNMKKDNKTIKEGDIIKITL